LQKLGVRLWPGRTRVIVLALIIPALLLPGTVSAKKEKPTAPTWQLYKAPYNSVWNAMVRTVVEDWKFAVRAGDPKEGFLATWPKTTPKQANKPKSRTSININVKKAPDGILVTASCLIEQYVPPSRGQKGRWVSIPSDHSCEANFLKDLEKRLAKKKR